MDHIRRRRRDCCGDECGQTAVSFVGFRTENAEEGVVGQRRETRPTPLDDRPTEPHTQTTTPPTTPVDGRLCRQPSLPLLSVVGISYTAIQRRRSVTFSREESEREGGTHNRISDPGWSWIFVLRSIFGKPRRTIYRICTREWSLVAKRDCLCFYYRHTGSRALGYC